MLHRQPKLVPLGSGERSTCALAFSHGEFAALACAGISRAARLPDLRSGQETRMLEAMTRHRRRPR